MDKDYKKTILPAMISNIADVIGIIGEDGVQKYISPNVEKIFGWTVEEVLGLSTFSFIHPDDALIVQKAFLSLLEKDHAQISLEYRLRCKNGEYRYFNSTGVNLTSNPEICGVLVTIHDITEQKKTEIKLKELMERSEQRFSKIFDEARMGIVIASPSLTIVNANPAFCQMLGYTEAALQNMAFKDITHPDHVDQDFENAKKLSLGEIPFYKSSKRYIKRNGDIIWCETAVSCLRDEYNNSYYFIALIDDITEREQNEETIKNLLDEKVLLLKETHHRIKNTMNTINSLLMLQAEKLKDPIAIEAFKDTRNRVCTLSVLYDKLNFSNRLKEISIKDFLPVLIDEILGTYSGNGSIIIEKDIDDISLSLNKAQPLGLIINELLTNIMKYAFTGRDKGLIKLSINAENSHVKLIMADNGIGMPEAVNFENSTGLGLRLIGMHAKQLAGKIRIERGNGTKIILEF